MNSTITRPKGFSKVELATLGVWFVAVGRWDYMGFSDADAQSFVMHFFKCLAGNPKDALRASYLSLQNTFMAMKRDTFDAILSEPPFSVSGRRNMKTLLRAWLDGEEAGFMVRWTQIFCSDSGPRVSEDRCVRVISNSGEREENAIQILTDDPEDRVNGEYWYLYYHYGRGWNCEMQMATTPDASGHRYDILHIRFQNGEKRRFYFRL